MVVTLAAQKDVGTEEATRTDAGHLNGEPLHLHATCRALAQDLRKIQPGRTPCPRTVLHVGAAVMFALLLLAVTYSQSSAKSYVDSRGNKVTFPLGDSSFADEVIEFKK